MYCIACFHHHQIVNLHLHACSLHLPFCPNPPPLPLRHLVQNHHQNLILPAPPKPGLMIYLMPKYHLPPLFQHHLPLPYDPPNPWPTTATTAYSNLSEGRLHHRHHHHRHQPPPIIMPLLENIIAY